MTDRIVWQRKPQAKPPEALPEISTASVQPYRVSIFTGLRSCFFRYSFYWQILPDVVRWHTRDLDHPHAFFQTLLLAGYACADALTNWITPRTQGYLHSVLLLSSLLAARGTHRKCEWRPPSNDPPVWSLTVLLAVSAGLAYFALASIGPLPTRTHPGRTPYRLYSLSNLRPLLGLLSYPFLIETGFFLRTWRASGRWIFLPSQSSAPIALGGGK
ncbi:MAG: hypothetical protein ACRD20_04645 [Terriglobales bacterium]